MIAGGVESMSQAPFLMSRATRAIRPIAAVISQRSTVAARKSATPA